jgi:hypothetical protein
MTSYQANNHSFHSYGHVSVQDQCEMRLMGQEIELAWRSTGAEYKRPLRPLLKKPSKVLLTCMQDTTDLQQG